MLWLRCDKRPVTLFLDNDPVFGQSMNGFSHSDPRQFRQCRDFAFWWQRTAGLQYPLLNAIKEQARATGELELDGVQGQLVEARKLRQAQASTNPPTDAPWCFFDLAELALYQGDASGFLENLEQGKEVSTAVWELKSCRDTLKETLRDKGIELAGLAEGIELLDKAIAVWPPGRGGA